MLTSCLSARCRLVSLSFLSFPRCLPDSRSHFYSYADLIGRRVRGWLMAENNYDSSTHRSDDATPQTRLEDFQACELTLRETVQGRNRFRAQGGPPAMWWL